MSCYFSQITFKLKQIVLNISGKMGNDGSKKNSHARPTTDITRSTTVNNSKYVLLLHYSQADSKELSNVENFRDALESEAHGMVDVSETYNLMECAYNNVPDSWLNNSHSVVVICLPSDRKAIESIGKVVQEKHFADEENRLRAKVLAISFGKAMPGGWPPSGISRPSHGKKDFCFGLEDGTLLAPNKFEGWVLQSLTQTIAGME